MFELQLNMYVVQTSTKNLNQHIQTRFFSEKNIIFTIFSRLSRVQFAGVNLNWTWGSVWGMAILAEPAPEP